MTNVISMNNNREHMLNLYFQGYGDANFDTEIEPLYFRPQPSEDNVIQTEIKTDKRAIYRSDTWDCLGVVSKKYCLVTHKQMINNQRAILERSDLDCTGIQERITVGSNGSKCFVQHTLPAHSLTTPDGDTAVLTFLGTNSYDGTFTFLLSGGARQGACMNGQVWTRGAATIYKAKHSRSLNINHAARIVGGALEVFAQQNEMWSTLSNTPFSTHEAKIAIFHALNLGSDFQKFEDNWKETGKCNKDYLYLLNAWNKYAVKLGKNQWAFYNAFTDWSTHAPAARKHADMNNLQRKREIIVQNVVTRLAA